MFFEKNSEEDFFNEVNEKLAKEQNRENLYSHKINHTVKLLISGAYDLHQAGMQKESKVTIMMAKDLCKDPAVNVSLKDMVNNLENEGWVFPKAKDLGLIDDEPTIEVEEDSSPDLHEF